MDTDPVPGRPRRGSRLLDASTEPPDLAGLVRRRQLAHLIALTLLAIGIVALIVSPGNNTNQDSSAATAIVGFSFILLGVTGVVSIQYTARIHRRRRRSVATQPFSPSPGPEFSPGSAGFRSIQQLRSAAPLLQSVLPEIEHIRPGITATAERTRLTLEHTAQRLVLEEQMLATLTNSTQAEDARAFQTRCTVDELATRLRSGVDQYVNLTQQATRTATSVGDLSGNQDLQEAGDQLAGLNLGLQEVQKLSAEEF